MSDCWRKIDGLYRIHTDKIAAHLRSFDLDVIVDSGAQKRANTDNAGRQGWEKKPVTLLNHHTGTSDSAAGDYPSLRVVRDGRTGLAGPLAQFGLGRSGTVYVLASGLAWHAGAVVKTEYDNWHSVGIEAEDNGTDAVVPKPLYSAYVRLNAALMHPDGLALKNLLGHKEVCKPAGRKIDPVFSMGRMRTDVAAFRRNTPSKQPTRSTRSVLRLGMVGEDVKRLQAGLSRVFPTYAKIAADGSYGYATANAVREFQKRAKADGRYPSEIDGQVGPYTRKALASYGVRI